MVPAKRSLLPPIAAVLAAAFLWLTQATEAAAVDIQRVVSPGGIEAWLVEDETVPLIAMDFAFRGGAAQEPDDKAGLANLMSGLLDEGAGDVDSAAFQDRLSDAAVRMSFSAARDAFYGELRTLAQNRDEAFELLRLAVNEPRFDAEPMERVRSQILTGMSRRTNDADFVASRLWQQTLFPDHPYGRLSDGTPATVRALTADDLRDLHGRIFARGELKIGVVGAIDAEELGAALDLVFGALPAEPDLVDMPPTEPALGETATASVPGPQTILRLGGRGLLRADDDFIPAFVMNQILGGAGFSSWLFEEVRESRGLTYGITSFMGAYDKAGFSGVATSTRPDRAEEALEIIEAQLRRMAEEGPSEAELSQAKRYLTGSYALRFDSSGRIASQLVGIQMDGLGIDYIDIRNGLIDAVTLDDVRRVAGRLFGDGRWSVVTVTPTPG